MLPKQIHIRRFLCAAIILYSSGLVTAAADRFGEWSLEQMRGTVHTLSFKQSMPLDNKNATSELAFACDENDKSKSVGSILIPFERTYENQDPDVTVLIQKNPEQYESSDLSQEWRNGFDYIFLDSQDDVNDLVSFLRANEGHGLKSVHFSFSAHADGSPERLNHIIINLSGFSDGFNALQTACAG
jgi:hypothetical protein